MAKRTEYNSVGMPLVFSPLAAWSLSLGCTVGWGAFVMPSGSYLPEAGPLGTVLGFAFGTLAMLAVAASYGFMAHRCEQDGGVYAYARQEFGPNHAFVCSWCLVLAYCASMVANATALALVIRSLFGSALQFGLHYQVAGYDVYLGEVLLGIAAIVLAGILCIRSTRATGLVETLLAVGMTAGIAGILLLALMSPYARAEALQPAFSPHVSPLRGTLSVVALVPWAFVGFESVSQVSGECSFPKKRFVWVMAAAIVCGAAMYLTLNTVAAMVIPEDSGNWAEYLNNLESYADVTAMPSFLAGTRLAGTAGLALFGVSALCAVLTGVVGFYVAASRLIYVMALDGALSRKLTRLNEQYRTPAAAVNVILAFTLVVPFFGRNVLSWIIDLQSLGALIAYLYTALATYRVAKREGRRGMAAVGICGIAVSALCMLLLVIPIAQLGTSLSMESYIILFAWVALGVNFYTPTVSR